jgi:transcriptional regulator with XRE-family HTH domain
MTGQEFRDARLRAGLQIEQCATYLGVAKSTIQRWEAGESSIPSEAADAMRAMAAHDHHPSNRSPAQAAAYAVGRVAAIVERASGRELPLSVRRHMDAGPLRTLAVLGRLAAQCPAAQDEIAQVLSTVSVAALEGVHAATDTAYVWLGYYHGRAAKA